MSQIHRKLIKNNYIICPAIIQINRTWKILLQRTYIVICIDTKHWFSDLQDSKLSNKYSFHFVQKIPTKAHKELDLSSQRIAVWRSTFLKVCTNFSFSLYFYFVLRGAGHCQSHFNGPLYNIKYSSQ